jgi:hypothetical protein
MIMHPPEEQLNDYVDGRLQGAARDSVSQHLLDCLQCQRSVAAIEEVVEEARLARDNITAPPELWPIVAATTVHDSIVRRHVFKRMWPQLGAAALLLMILSGAAGVFGTRLAMRMDRALNKSNAYVARIAVPGTPARAPMVIGWGRGEGGTAAGGANGAHSMPGVQMEISDFVRSDLSGEAASEQAHALIIQLDARESAVLDRLEAEAKKHGWTDFGVAARERLASYDRRLALARDAYLGASNFGSALAEKVKLEQLYKQRATLLERLLREGKESWERTRLVAPAQGESKVQFTRPVGLVPPE